MQHFLRPARRPTSLSANLAHSVRTFVRCSTTGLLSQEQGVRSSAFCHTTLIKSVTAIPRTAQTRSIASHNKPQVEDTDFGVEMPGVIFGDALYRPRKMPRTVLDLKKELAQEIGLFNLKCLELYRTKFVHSDPSINASKKNGAEVNSVMKSTSIDEPATIDLYSKEPLADDASVIDLMRDPNTTPFLQAMLTVNVRLTRGPLGSDDTHKIRVCSIFNPGEFESELKRVVVTFQPAWMPKFSDYRLKYVYTDKYVPIEDQPHPFATLTHEAIMETINEDGVFKVLGKRSWKATLKIVALFLAVAHVVIGTYIFIL